MSLSFIQHNFLLIDDSDIDSVITSKILQLAGLPKELITTREARTGLDFLNTAEQFYKDKNISDTNPLIILLDIHMPEMNGFVFLEHFDKMATSVTDFCKVFLLTSSIDPSDIENANNNAYVVRVLNKPLNVDELLLCFD